MYSTIKVHNAKKKLTFCVLCVVLCSLVGRKYYGTRDGSCCAMGLGFIYSLGSFECITYAKKSN